MAVGATQPLTETSARDVSCGGKYDRCVGLTILPPSRVDCLQILGASTYWSPKGTVQACTGIALPIIPLPSIPSNLTNALTNVNRIWDNKCVTNPRQKWPIWQANTLTVVQKILLFLRNQFLIRAPNRTLFRVLRFPEDGGSKFPRKVCNYIPLSTALHSRRLPSVRTLHPARMSSRYNE
jgi:hypothetical protein